AVAAVVGAAQDEEDRGGSLSHHRVPGGRARGCAGTAPAAGPLKSVRNPAVRLQSPHNRVLPGRASRPARGGWPGAIPVQVAAHRYADVLVVTVDGRIDYV